jgi:uncharacterized protein YcbK (DUF882 family)
MSVIDKDEITRNYRTRARGEHLHDKPLRDIQKVLLICVKEMPENERSHLCLQDVFIDRDTVHNKHLQRLSKQNKTNIKSLYLDTSETASNVLEIIDLFGLKDLNCLQKLYYNGYNRKETEVDILLFPCLQTLSLLWGQLTRSEGNLSQCLEIDKYRIPKESPTRQN